jgi:hypothetical protein
MIEARTKMRLAEEYDAAQSRGEIRTRADNQLIPEQNKLSPSEIDPSLPKLAFEGRQLLKAEAADPGIVQRTIEERLDAGQEPTKAALREARIIRDAELADPTQPDCAETLSMPRNGNPITSQKYFPTLCG